MRFRVCLYLVGLLIGVGSLKAQNTQEAERVGLNDLPSEEPEEILYEEEKVRSFFDRVVNFLFFRQRVSHYSVGFEERSSAEWTWIRAQRTNSGIGLLSGPVVLTQSLKQRSKEELSPGGMGGGMDLDEEAEGAKKHTPKDLSASYAALRADTTWLSRYREVCHSSSINPYKVKWKNFSDTLSIELYNPLKTLSWRMPLPKMVVTSDFGMRRHRWHYGIDIRLERGDSVCSAFYGIVRLSNYQRRGFGHYVVVHHYNGLETIYAHLSKRLVKEGEIIRAGDVIGLGGSTGRSSAPHLHLEVRYEGLPINPNEIFDFEKGCIRVKDYMLTPGKFAYIRQAKSVRFHRVRRGQTLSHISRYYGVSVSRLCRLNRISRRSIIRVGQRIRIR